MRILKTTFLITALAALTVACNKDDNNSSNNNVAIVVDEVNNLEDAPVAISIINSDISIEGASKRAGLPPEPNSSINFSIPDAGTDLVAVQSGFNIKFNSSADVAGAYILFGDKSGTKAAEHFDIPVSNLVQTIAPKSNTKGSKALHGKSNKVNVENEFEINIDLLNDFPPGQFCGELCIYDSANNISQTIQVCAEVEAWGGSSTLVGEWALPFDYETYNETIFCNTEGSFLAPWEKDNISSGTVIINANGTYSVSESETFKELDYTASAESCTPIYTNGSLSYTETGKWAYNEKDKSLIIITFTEEEIYNGETWSATYPNGDLSYDSTNSNSSVAVVGNKMIITETYVDYGETITETFELTRI